MNTYDEHVRAYAWYLLNKRWDNFNSYGYDPTGPEAGAGFREPDFLKWRS